MKKLEHGLELFVFASRWIQAPMFIGLILAQGVCAYRFLLDMIALFPMVSEKHSEKLLLGVLGLVDMLMVANLIMWQVVIHVVFHLSSLILSISERILHPSASHPSPTYDAH